MWSAVRNSALVLLQQEENASKSIWKTKEYNVIIQSFKSFTIWELWVSGYCTGQILNYLPFRTFKFQVDGKILTISSQ